MNGEKKSFQILMNPSAHARLKTRARACGLCIGEMIENMLAAVEIRAEKLRATLPAAVAMRIDIAHLITVLHLQDGGEDALAAQMLAEIAEDLTTDDDEWTPEIIHSKKTEV